MNLSALIAEYQNISIEISKAIDENNCQKVRELDVECSKIFANILQIVPQCNDEACLLAEFLLNELISVNQRSGVEDRVCAKVKRILISDKALT